MTSLLFRSAAFLFAMMIVSMPSVLAAAEESGPEPASPTAREVRDRLDAFLDRSVEVAAGAVSVAHADTLAAVYRDRGWEPIWVRADDVAPALETLLEHLESVEEHGLDPAHYGLSREHRLLAVVRDGGGSPTERAEFDVAASCALVRLGMDLASGRLDDPRSLPIPWEFADQPVPARALLDGVASTGEMDWPASMVPHHPRYRRLQQALRRYESIAADGGWPGPIPGDAVVGRGEKLPDRMRRRLRARLAAEGFWLGPVADARGRAPDAVAASTPADRDTAAAMVTFDDATVAALERFQRSRGLLVDGILGPETRAHLAQTPAEIVRVIVANLERWRWLPDDLPPRRIEVNAPAYELQLFERGRRLRTMPVIVGKEGWATPAFTDELTHIIFNPYWFVPRTIAGEDILPNILEDEDYLEANSYKVFATWEDARADDTPDMAALRPDSLDWEGVDPAAFPWVLRKEPGPTNPLGFIKFMMPNEHAIYLHATPANGLFDAHERSFSHGCIRIEDPHWLAAYLLEPLEWDEYDVRREIGNRDRHRVDLPEPMRVFILQFTAFVDDVGTLHLRDDIYGFDRQTLDALARRPPCPAG